MGAVRDKAPSGAVADREIVHGTAVAVGGRAALLVGASGAGKSALALSLIALGARLVADDRTVLVRRDDALVASAPKAIAGVIEARGVGILRAPRQPFARLAVVVDMERQAAARLPEIRTTFLLGVRVEVMDFVAQGHFPAALFLYLVKGRVDAA